MNLRFTTRGKLNNLLGKIVTIHYDNNINFGVLNNKEDYYGFGNLAFTSKDIVSIVPITVDESVNMSRACIKLK